MKSHEYGPLDDGELDRLLKTWTVPQAPSARMRAALFASRGKPWHQYFWKASVRIPVPVAAAIVILIGLVLMYRPAPAPPITLVRTQRVELPVVTERVVTKVVFRNPPPPSAETFSLSELKPVAEFRPRIIRSAYENR